jgi:hypothetical protein
MTAPELGVTGNVQLLFAGELVIVTRNRACFGLLSPSQPRDRFSGCMTTATTTPETKVSAPTATIAQENPKRSEMIPLESAPILAQVPVTVTVHSTDPRRVARIGSYVQCTVTVIPSAHPTI